MVVGVGVVVTGAVVEQPPDLQQHRRRTLKYELPQVVVALVERKHLPSLTLYEGSGEVPPPYVEHAGKELPTIARTASYLAEVVMACIEPTWHLSFGHVFAHESPSAPRTHPLEGMGEVGAGGGSRGQAEEPQQQTRRKPGWLSDGTLSPLLTKHAGKKLKEGVRTEPDQ